MAGKAVGPSATGKAAVVVSYKDVWRVPDGFDSDDGRPSEGYTAPRGDKPPGAMGSVTKPAESSIASKGDHSQYEDSSEVYMSAASTQNPLPSVLRSRIYTPGSPLLTKDRVDADSASMRPVGGCQSMSHSTGVTIGKSAVSQGDDFDLRKFGGGKDRVKGWPRWRRMADSVQSIGTEGMKSSQTRSFKTLHENLHAPKSDIDLGDMQRALEDGGFLHVKFGWRAIEAEAPPGPPAVTYEECEGRKSKKGDRCKKGLRRLRALIRSDGRGEREDKGAKASAKGQAPMCISCLWRRPEAYESSASFGDGAFDVLPLSPAHTSKPCAGPLPPISSSAVGAPLSSSLPSLTPITPARSPSPPHSGLEAWRDDGVDPAEVEGGVAGEAPRRRCSSGPEISLSLDVDSCSRVTSGSFDGWEVVPSLRGTGAATLAHRWKPPVFKTDAQYAARQLAFQNGSAKGRFSEVWPQLDDSRTSSAMTRFTKLQSVDTSTKQSMEGSTWDECSIPDWGFFDASKMHTLEPEDCRKQSLSFSDFGLQPPLYQLCSRD